MKKVVSISVAIILLILVIFKPNNKVQKIHITISSPNMVAAEATVEPHLIKEYTYYDNCRITYYCGCEICNGDWVGQPTASGLYPTSNHTVAMEGLPFGTKIMFDDKEYIVEDRGVYGNAVDVYVESHQEASDNGEHYADVYIVNEHWG